MAFKNKSCDAFTGLEAAIVLIAFVVVAAVFSYVVLGAGFYTSQKSQETIYKSVEQATANLQMTGRVYGSTNGGTDTTIEHIEFNVGLAPGASPIDLSKMTIVVSQPSEAAVKTLSYGTTASDMVFTVSNTIDADPIVDGTLKNQQQAKINFDVSPAIHRNGQVSIELRPSVGAALQVSKTAPASIQASQPLS
jgi:archaeal flagellin FlaB